jgi:hypothetical protein
MRVGIFSVNGFGMNAPPGLHCMPWETASASLRFSLRCNLKPFRINAKHNIGFKKDKPPGLSG